MGWVGRILGEASKNAAYGLLFGKLLKQKQGARLLSGSETSQLLSSKNTGLLIDGNQGRLSERDSFQNLCVIARVGAGKTSRFVIPNVLDKAKQNCSIVVNDPKGEVFAETSGYMQSRGFRVITLNPEDLEQSARFNPLLEAKSDLELEQIAEILVKAGSGTAAKDAFWDNGGIRLVSILLKLLRRAGESDPALFTLGNLFSLLSNFGTDGSPLDDFVIKWAYDPLNPNDTSLWEEWQGATTGNSNAVQSFALTALTALRAFTNQNMVRLTASSSFDLETLRNTKSIIYFIIPAQHAEYYAFWTSVFFRSVFNTAMRKMPSKNTIPSYILFDEFAHGYIPSFVSVANTIRGYRVSLSIVLQSLSQLSARYGHDYAKSIQGGFNSYLAYSGSDQTSAQFFEAVAGKVIETRKEKIEDVKYQREEYNLLNADAIRRIDDHQALFISANKNPAILNTEAYFTQSRFKRISKRYGQAHLDTITNEASPKRINLK